MLREIRFKTFTERRFDADEVINPNDPPKLRYAIYSRIDVRNLLDEQVTLLRKFLESWNYKIVFADSDEMDILHIAVMFDIDTEDLAVKDEKYKKMIGMRDAFADGLRRQLTIFINRHNSLIGKSEIENTAKAV